MEDTQPLSFQMVNTGNSRGDLLRIDLDGKLWVNQNILDQLTAMVAENIKAQDKDKEE